jgi:alcohol dehydrogenase
VAPGELEWREVPEPRLTDPGQAIVEPLVVATCDLDAPMIAGETPYRGPIAVGHECIARVLEVGAAVRTVRPGDRVVVPFQVSCGACAPCRRGHTGICAAVPPLAMYGFGRAGGDYGGAIADRLSVRFADAMLVPLPAALDARHLASLADNLPDAYRAVAGPLAARPGASVLVVGGQCVSIGLYAVMLARALGAGRVVYLDPDGARCERAAALGAEAVCAPYPERAADRHAIAVDASADPRGLACAVRSLAPEGVCTSAGGYFTEATPVPLRELYLGGGALVTGRCHARPAIEPLIALAVAGAIDPAPVTATVAPLGDAAEVLAAGRREKQVFVRAGAEVGL